MGRPSSGMAGGVGSTARPPACARGAGRGAARIEGYIERNTGIHIPHRTIHEILDADGEVQRIAKGGRRRKWTRWECSHSNGVTGRMLRYRVERCRAEGVEGLRARGGRSARCRAATAKSASPAKPRPGRSTSRLGLGSRGPAAGGSTPPAPAQGQKAQGDGRFEPAARPAFLGPLWAVPEPSARPKVQGTNRLPVPTPH